MNPSYQRLRKLEFSLIPDTRMTYMTSKDIEEKARALLKLSELELEAQEIYQQIFRDISERHFKEEEAHRQAEKGYLGIQARLTLPIDNTVWLEDER